MLKTRLILVAVTALLIWLLYLLPRGVVKNEAQLTVSPVPTDHAAIPDSVLNKIRTFRSVVGEHADMEKSAIFADSLSDLYAKAGRFDSAGYYAEQSAAFFNTVDSWIRAGNQYYQAYLFAVEPARQSAFAAKAQEYYEKVLVADPRNFEVKSKLAMTLMTPEDPMKGIAMLREVIEADPENEFALYNMGALSFQSGQYALAIQRLETLVRLYPGHLQGQLLLGVSYLNAGEKDKARTQLERLKEMSEDPAVKATADSYLKELNK